MTPAGPVLGLESSCDETAAAVLAPDGTILAEAVLSQEAEHAAFGGVVPEIAARAHLAALPGLAARVLAQAGLRPADLGAVAATSGPGLIGGLIVGSCFGKGMAIAHGLPFVAVNHLEAHALTVRLPGLVPGGAPGFPYLLLLVSGGHCQCVAVEGIGRYRRLGTTLDDAVGEAFDKAAKLLGLPWPGGPHLERLAAGGDARAVALPRPLLGRAGCDFSFSGLKTAVARAVAGGDGAARGHRRLLPGGGGAGAGRSRPPCPGDAAGGGRAGGGRRRGGERCRAGRAGGRGGGRGRADAGPAAAAVYRQCGDGGLGRDRAAARRPGRPPGPRAAAALAAR